jgi:hypothetical protein
MDSFSPDHMFDEMEAELPLYEKEPQKWLAIWRNRYDPAVFQILTHLYGPTLDAFWKTHRPPLNSKKAFVLVERRCHPNLWFILRNIAYFGRDWSIYIFCSKQNAAYIAEILGDKLHHVHLNILFTESVDAATGVREYNELLKQRGFWERIDAENLCTIEMDCYLRRPIPDELLDYDFVGTPWGWALNTPGGTGLTLRKKTAMLDVCDHGDPKTPMQDHFASEGMFLRGHEYLASAPDGIHTFVENYYTEDPVGVHQWWTFFFNRFLYGQEKQIARKLLTLQI